MKLIKVVGVMFEGRQELLEQLYDIPAREISVVLKREPANKYDSNAVKIVLVHNNLKYEIGYIAADIVKEYAKELDTGKKFDIRVSKIDMFRGTYYCELADMTS